MGAAKEMPMEVTEEQRGEMEKIASGINCPKEFACCKPGSENVCKTRDIGLEQYLECLDEDPQSCDFSLSFGTGYFCTCPVQLYIAKNLNK
jgi:hypothetical protein